MFPKDRPKKETLRSVTDFLSVLLLYIPINKQTNKKHRFHPWVRKIPWRRKWNNLQYSCLGNPIGREAQWATVPGVSKELDST